ncbi:precorrin-3B synthase [Roseobacter sp. EG26]|uniref:precorrin-3B synthase n=1 Tax=Roseobacter sp. EG26 TaxID=3412477 RepID=UPI003CE4D0E7
MIARPSVKGWCPGAFRPMQSGDGLIVRVRPFLARLTAAQMLGLCDLAETYGNGFIDLTNRANLQIRGVTDGGFDTVLDGLNALGLLDETPELEARRNIIVSPFWENDGETARVARALLQALPDLPELPAKFGFAVDLEPERVLQNASADIRIERYDQGSLVRADGAIKGLPVARGEEIAAVLELGEWFAANRTAENRRMAHILSHRSLPESWQLCAPIAATRQPKPGQHPLGTLVGAAFGQMHVETLTRLIQQNDVQAIRLTPWRLILLEGAQARNLDGFVTHPDDPLLKIDACPGAPFCASATVKTRELARRLAPSISGSLHISGCAKGCARKSGADMVFVGNAGGFDLVRKGHAWDAPEKSGLRPDDILAELASHP